MADNGDIDDKALAGIWYADTFHVGYNALQFKVDCGHDSAQRSAESPGESPGERHAPHDDEDDAMKVYLRIIASPMYARELFKLLGSGLLQYADRYGPIPAAGPRPLRREP